MPILSPLLAANIARAVYEVETDQRLADQNDKDKSFGSGGAFEIADEFIFSGTTGPWFQRSRTGFGFVGKGMGPGNVKCYSRFEVQRCGAIL